MLFTLMVGKTPQPPRQSPGKQTKKQMEDSRKNSRKTMAFLETPVHVVIYLKDRKAERPKNSWKEAIK